ncbi:hypothetical protein TNCV_2167211 [Trichonephila clavipes]|nr:hypothetical protein TNCV_2167211 [Trichonephila clavipes]
MSRVSYLPPTYLVAQERVLEEKNRRDHGSGWTAQQVALQVGRSDLTVRRFGDQWTKGKSFTRPTGSVRHQQTSCQEDHHIIRELSVEPTASLATVQTQETP